MGRRRAHSRLTPRLPGPATNTLAGAWYLKRLLCVTRKPTIPPPTPWPTTMPGEATSSSGSTGRRRRRAAIHRADRVSRHSRICSRHPAPRRTLPANMKALPLPDSLSLQQVNGKVPLAPPFFLTQCRRCRQLHFRVFSSSGSSMIADAHRNAPTVSLALTWRRTPT